MEVIYIVRASYPIISLLCWKVLLRLDKNSASRQNKVKAQSQLSIGRMIDAIN